MTFRRRGLGPIHIPPLPNAVVLTDRTDGTRWFLSHNDDARMLFTDVVPTGFLGKQIVEYPADEGPIVDIDNESIRMLARGGRLGYEKVDYAAASADVYSRKNYERTNYKITRGEYLMGREGSLTIGQRLGYEDIVV